MITQTNFQGTESDPSDIKKEMSPQTNIHAPNFEDDEFDIPPVALPGGAMAEEKITNQAQESQSPNNQPSQENVQHQHQPIMNQYQNHHGHQAYNDGYYHQQNESQQQWLGEYNQINYNHYNQGYQQYSIPVSQHHGYNQYPVYQQHEDMYHQGMNNPNMPPGRSPSGSHSTPSPHSHAELGDDHAHHLSDLKRPHADAFRTDNMNLQNQNPPKKPKVSRRKKKRDPNEPQKPVSAYALFFRDSQASIKSRNPNLSFGDVSKMVASLWDSLDTASKANYKKRTETAKKEYLRQLASYRATLVSKGQGDEIYGFPGYGYPGMNNIGMGQNIPPHPPGPPLVPHQQHHQGPHLGPGTYMTNSQEYLNHQAATHGTDISTGNQAGMPSLPTATPETGNTANSPSPSGGPYPTSPEGSYCSENGTFNSNGNYYDNPSFNPNNLATHDRNHNSPGFQPRVPGQCGRPGCQNQVTKAADGTESTYCSSECVVGQCREVYQGWASSSPLPSQQPLPPQVK